jgi:hypothetical protein
MRDYGYLRSIPPCMDEKLMPEEIVSSQLLLVGLCEHEGGESGTQRRARLRIAILMCRSARTEPAPRCCDHCAHVWHCTLCGTQQQECECVGQNRIMGCVLCFRAGKRGRQELMHILEMRHQEIELSPDGVEEDENGVGDAPIELLQVRVRGRFRCVGLELGLGLGLKVRVALTLTPNPNLAAASHFT